MYRILFFLVCWISLDGSAQDISGVWQGMLIGAGGDLEKADVIYLELKEHDGDFSGYARIELVNRSEFAIKQLVGKRNGDRLELEEKYLNSSSNARNDPKCKLNYNVTFEEESGYLKGSFQSSDCRRYTGTVVLYRSKMSFNTEKDPASTHMWKAVLVRDYKKGYPSPEVRAIERTNFEFQPIYFDHDQSEIKPEFYDYLNKIARVVDGHSDLRVKVTGHTDAVGSDAYNIGLSERRAKAIVDYFLSQGIKEDKLEFDFKGKRMPAATNETTEGKQRNRRVDFEFI